MEQAETREQGKWGGKREGEDKRGRQSEKSRRREWQSEEDKKARDGAIRGWEKRVSERPTLLPVIEKAPGLI